MAGLMESLKKQPGRVDLRTRLFQLFCLRGEWARAKTQLGLLAELDQSGGDMVLAVTSFMSLLDVEQERLEVFAGSRPPVIFGEPPEWIGLHLEGIRLMASGNEEAAAKLFRKGMELAEPSAGKINGEPFEWLMDSDARFGPALEVIVGAKYYWMPFTRIENLEFWAPEELHERVWLGGNITLVNGTMLQAYVPVRYPGTEKSQDSEVVLARATEWREIGERLCIGTGQRFWSTDNSEIPIFKLRRLEFQHSTP